MALYCDDYEAERDAYLASGAELAYEAHVGPTRTCWVDTAATLGCMVELREPSPIRDRKSTRLNSSHSCAPRMPPSAYKTQTGRCPGHPQSTRLHSCNYCETRLNLLSGHTYKI